MLRIAVRLPRRHGAPGIRLGAWLLAALTVLTLLAPSASGYATFGDHRLRGGILVRYFFIDSTATGSVDVAAVSHAHTVWNSSSTQFYFERQYAGQGAATQFHRNSTSSGAQGFCAQTLFFDSGQVSPTAQDWAWSRANIDPANFTSAALCGTQTDQHRGAILAHEWGHGIGLAHTSNSATLMYQLIAGTGVTAPAQDDANGVNHLYP